MRGWTRILRRGVLVYVLLRLSLLWCYRVFCCSVPLRVIIVFRDIIYVIIISIRDIWLSVNTFGRMCETIDLGSCIRWVFGFSVKTGYDKEILSVFEIWLLGSVNLVMIEYFSGLVWTDSLDGKVITLCLLHCVTAIISFFLHEKIDAFTFFPFACEGDVPAMKNRAASARKGDGWMASHGCFGAGLG
jgi:hypothetical protein